MTRWQVELTFAEDIDRTEAVALLRTPDGTLLRGTGRARRNPKDRPAASVGEEVAGAQALSRLADELWELAAGDVEHNVRRDDPAI